MPWERNADGHRTLKRDWWRGELPEGVTKKQVIAIEQAMDEFFKKHPQPDEQIPLAVGLKTHYGSTLRDVNVVGFNEHVEFSISVDIYGNIGHEWWGHGGGYDFIHGDVEDENDEICDVEEDD
jgi:hypothetical protein